MSNHANLHAYASHAGMMRVLWVQVRIQRADPARILLNVDDIPHTTTRALKLAQRELELSSPEELDSSSSSSSGDTKNRMWLRMQGMVLILEYAES